MPIRCFKPFAPPPEIVQLKLNSNILMFFINHPITEKTFFDKSVAYS